MKSPKGFILYRIWYGDHLAYLGRTKQPLRARIRGHMFNKPMHRSIDIHNVTKIEYAIVFSDDSLTWNADSIFSSETLELGEFCYSEIDVIGNVFDNPELMEVGE